MNSTRTRASDSPGRPQLESDPNEATARSLQPDLIEAERTRLLYESSKTSIPTALLLAAGLVYVLWDQVPQRTALIWLALSCLVYLQRGILTVIYLRTSPPPESARRWMNRLLAGTLVSGALWGAGIWLLYPEGSTVHQAFLCVLISGLSAGAVTSLSGSRFAVLSFLALSVLPLVARLLSEDSEVFQLLGLLSLLFFAVAGTGANRIGANILQNIRLRLAASAREQALRQSEERLAESEEKYRRLFEQSDDPMWLIIREHFVMANSAACRVLGYGHVDELLNTRPEDLSPPVQGDGQASADKAVQMMRTAHEKGYHRFEWLHRRRNGEVFPVEVTLTKVPVEKEQALFVVWRDITERKAAEAALRESEHKYRSLMEHSPLSIQEVSPEGRTLRVNRAWEKLWGVPFAALKDYNLFEDQELIARGIMPTIERAFAGEVAEVPEIEYDKANVPAVPGQPGKLWVRTLLYPLLGADGELREVVLIQEDVTERKNQDEHILRQAHFDSLTGLPNRFLALDRLGQLISEAPRTRERVAVLFLDLDDFKKINDTLGHDTGDKALTEAASRLLAGVRPGDTVGRLGGDEFIVLLGGLAQAADAGEVAEALLDQMRDAVRIDKRDLILTTSIGISIYPDDGDTPSELLRKADSAMYHSKAQGRNTYSYFTDEMNRGVTRRLLLEEQMHGALGRGELSLCYQPQVDLASREIVSVEALLRWHNPTLGPVSPMELIPIAEHTGLIVPIGRFVLTQAIEMAAKWERELGRGITVAVNLSPRQFRDPELEATVTEAIRRFGAKAELLELEITEGVLMAGHAKVGETLHALARRGISIAMDDFGTGYSSLSYLRSFPFHVLKIDREFVSDMADDSGDRELVSAAIAMAHGLGLKVVAEGVETAEQLALLSERGCDYAQGYLFSVPVSAEEMTGLLGRIEDRSDPGEPASPELTNAWPRC